MAVAWRSFSADSATLGGDPAPAKPSGTVSGDLLIAVAVTSSAQVDPPDGSWTLLAASPDNSHRAWWKNAGGSEPSSYSFAVGGTSSSIVAIARYDGHDPTTPFDDVKGIGGTAGLVIPAATAAASSRFYAQIAAKVNNTTFTPPGTVTERWDAPATAHTSAGGDEVVASGSTGTRTWTPAAGSGQGVAFGFIIAPAPPATKQGSATGSWEASGSATGTEPEQGSASGSWSATGTATGVEPEQGSATGGWSASGSASGIEPEQGSATGTWSASGSATGLEAEQGSAAGAWTVSGAATGVEPEKGSASGSWAAAGTASGLEAEQGSASGAWSANGSAVGVEPEQGSASGSWAFGGFAFGNQPGVNSAHGTWSFGGAATGKTSLSGEATGSWSAAGVSSGQEPPKGSAAGSWEASGSGSGAASQVGSAVGGWAFIGSATGVEAGDGLAYSARLLREKRWASLLGSSFSARIKP